MNWRVRVSDTGYDMWNIPEIFSSVHWHASAASFNMGFIAAAFVCSFHFKTVVEVGICNGFITQVLGRAMSASVGKEGLLVSCDIQEASCNLADNLLRGSYVSHRYKLLCADSAKVDWKEHLEGRPIDMAVIDGDHTFEAASADLNNVGPLVRHNGIILAHDYAGGHPGVVQAVNLFVSQGGWSLVEVPETGVPAVGYALAILQRREK